MYGYLRTYSDELKLKQIRLYKKYYCTLCNLLNNEIGIIYRFLTSYDITLFLIIFDSLVSDKKEYKIKCPTKIGSYNFQVSEKAANYSLIVCLYWVREKLKDDYKDEKKHRVLYRIFSRNKRIKDILDNEIVNEWESVMTYYYQMEQNENASFDELIKAIGQCYGSVFRDFGKYADIEIDSNMMYQLGKNLGEYVYIMDAYDDYFEDKKKKRFNPIFRMQNYEMFADDRKEITERIEFILDIVCAKLQQIINNIYEHENDQIDIIRNILSYGIWTKFNSISKKYIDKHEKCNRKNC